MFGPPSTICTQMPSPRHSPVCASVTATHQRRVRGGRQRTGSVCDIVTLEEHGTGTSVASPPRSSKRPPGSGYSPGSGRQRQGEDSNRREGICSPLPTHSATLPWPRQHSPAARLDRPHGRADSCSGGCCRGLNRSKSQPKAMRIRHLRYSTLHYQAPVGTVKSI